MKPQEISRCFSSVSFWTLVAFLCLIILQYFPVTGIFLMMFGAAMIAGLLVHVFLISLLVEALMGRIPRLFILLPILAYAGYYIVYANEARHAAQVSAELKAANPGKILTYTPDQYSLVMPSSYSLAVTGKIENFVTTHDVPVAYEPNANYPEGYLSYRLIPKDQCNRIVKDSQARIQTFGVLFHGAFLANLCMLRVPEQPQHKIISVVTPDFSEDLRQYGGIRKQTFEVIVDGKTVATYKTASFWQLPSFPFLLIGCALNDAASSWSCAADFNRNLRFIDGIPDQIDHTQYDDPVSAMFAIRKSTKSDLLNFKNPDTEAIAHIQSEAARVDDNVFSALQDVIDGKNSKPPFNLGYSIASRPDRLPPYAQGMAHRFVELNNVKEATPYKREQLEALATGLGALSHEDFEKIIVELVNGGDAWARDSVLYLRMGENQKGVLPFYRAQFLDDRIRGYGKVLAVLGICRVGSADPDLIVAMKSRYDAISHVAESQQGELERNLRQSLFVTLLQVGEKSYLMGDTTVAASHDATWYASLLNGEGTTAIGPNNCMPRKWPLASYLSPSLGPVLK